jgi:hypothetical protein
MENTLTASTENVFSSGFSRGFFSLFTFPLAETNRPDNTHRNTTINMIRTVSDEIDTLVERIRT